MSNRHDDPKFDEHFSGWMGAAFEYERLKKAGKPIPKRVQDALNWPDQLSAADYDALIH